MRRGVHPSCALGAFLLLLGAAPAAAQCSGNWLPGHGVQGVGSTGSPTVDHLFTLPDGSLIVAGSFTMAGDVPASGVARYNPTTSAWSSLGWTYGIVISVLSLPDGDLLIGGQFTVAGATSAHNIARYHPGDGGIWSPLGAGVSQGNVNTESVTAMTLLPSGDVLVAGDFTLAGGVPSNAVALYHPATNSWSPIAGLAASAHVTDAALLPNGDVLLCGGIAYSDARPSTSVARLNVQAQTWTSAGNGPAGGVYVLLRLTSGDVVAGGAFTYFASGSSVNRIARYNPSTNAWSPLFLGVAGSASFASVEALAQLPSGDIVAGGSFATAGYTYANCLARYSPANDWWYALGSGFQGSNIPVYALATLPGGDLIVGGNFFTASGVSASRIARCHPATDTWSALGTGVQPGAFATLADGSILASVRLSTPSGPPTFLARYDNAANSWTSISGLDGGGGALRPLPGGDLLVGGAFTHAGGAPAQGLAVYHPAADTWTAIPTGPSGGSHFALIAVERLLSGEFVVGGSFTTAGSIPANNIARYNPSTGAWATLSSGVNDTVLDMLTLDDGDLLVGGNLYTVGGVHTQCVGRYHPQTDSWTNANSPFRDGSISSIQALLKLPSGQVIAGGYLFTSGGSPSDGIARYDPQTNAWSAIPGLGGIAYSLALAPDGTVLVGGYFSSAGGLPCNYVARLDPQTNLWSPLGSGADYIVSHVAGLPNNDAIASGQFLRAGGHVSAYFARFVAPSADFDHDGDTGTDADIEAFFACLAGACCPTCTADFNADGDLGTDADIESFFRVLAGGTC